MAKNVVTFESYCEMQRWKPCGLNADWCVEAYAIRGTGPYGTVALDNEDGTYSIVYHDGAETITNHFTGSFEDFVAFCEHVVKPVLHG